jgi:hypothetical protein
MGNIVLFFISLSNPRMGNIVLFISFFLYRSFYIVLFLYRSFLFRFFIFSLSTSLLSLLQQEILDAAVVVSAVGLGLISRFK